jgi:ABC-type antimicrobial peptide transport system ATPase subunit
MRDGGLISEFGPFSREEMALKAKVQQITAELKRRFFSQPMSACSEGQVVYNKSGGEVTYTTTRPGTGSGTIYITITSCNSGMWRFKCMYSGLGLTAMRSGYRRNIVAEQMVHVVDLLQRPSSCLDPADVRDLCTVIMGLRDIEYYDTPDASK